MLVEPPTILALDRDHLVATWRDVVLVNWRIATAPAAPRELRDITERFIDARPSGIAWFVIIEAAAPLPSAEARESLAGTLRDFGGRMHASAVVMEGQGFRAAAVRSVVTGVVLVSRLPHPHRVFHAAPEGCAWLEKQCGDAVARKFVAADLLRAIESARSHRAADHGLRSAAG